MGLNIIAAVAAEGAIGRGGDLAFHISADLKHFKALTMGHPVIMGRKTFESLPKGALPGRRNIVVTRNKDWRADNVETASSIKEAVDMAGDGAFVIGGAQIYNQAMPLADTLYITRIFADAPDADTFFPPYEDEEWELKDFDELQIDASTLINYQFQTYIRKN